MRRLAALAAAALLGCLTPKTLDETVLEYDRSVNRVEAELLLLNIARARHHRPIHFTAVSSVAATYELRVAGALTGRLGPSPEDAPVDLGIGGSVAENPTITIVPVSGREFTERVLRPLEEPQFHFLAQQDFPIDMILRLLARAVVVEQPAGAVTLTNSPAQPEAYAEFRRRVLHLAGLARAGRLWVGPIAYEAEEPVPLARGPSAAEAMTALAEGLRWRRDGGGGFWLVRRRNGRVAITNYDPQALSDAERAALDAAVRRLPPSCIPVDVRADRAGGDYPLRGWFTLRSLAATLAFLARGIAEEREFPVAPDTRSHEVGPNPALSLEIAEGRHVSSDAAFAVRLDDQHYWIRKLPVSEGMLPAWNQQAFTLLTNLFQLTVSDVPEARTPLISIPK